MIEGNRLENCWTAAQPGYAVLFTVRNSGGRAPWATIEEVTFRSNVVSHAAGGIDILAFDSTAESRTASGISIENNLFEDIDHRRWGGNGLFLQVGNGPVNVTVDHNTVLHTGNVITAYGRSRGAFIPAPGFRFTNNVAAHNAYGIFGSSAGYRQRAITAYFPDSPHRRERPCGRPGVPLSGRKLLPVDGAAECRFRRRRAGHLPPLGAQRLSSRGAGRNRPGRQLRRAGPRADVYRSLTGSSRRCSLIL